MEVAGIDFVFWLPVIIAAVGAGATTGAIGVYIVAMEIPFLAVCVSHAALVGAVLGIILGLEGNSILIPAFLCAISAAGVVGMFDPEKTRIGSNVVIGIIFSFTMGLAFLGIGLFDRLGHSDNDIRNLLWGNLILCNWEDVKIILGTGIIVFFFITLFFRKLHAIMFSRVFTEACGINVPLIWTGFLTITALTLTVNFQIVGGLMIYGLLVNPAISALQLSYRYPVAIVLSIIIGVVSSLVGFFISAYLDLPVGATIVIVASVITMLTFLYSYLKSKK